MKISSFAQKLALLVTPNFKSFQVFFLSRVGKVGVGMKFKICKKNSHKCSVHHQAAAVVLVGAVKGVLCDVFYIST